MPTVTAEKPTKAQVPTLIEPFLARLNDCVKQVVAIYPKEILFWVQGTGTNLPMHEDKDVDLFDLQFSKVEAHAHWNTIDKPVPHPVGLGVRQLPPLNTILPLADAIRKMGMKPFVKMELYWPLTPEAKRPFYVFELADGTAVRIDA